MEFVKAHAYGNDFLLREVGDLGAAGDAADLARLVCARHTGAGADGLMLVAPTGRGAVTRLFNADGSDSEISGNGLRCVAAWLARERDLGPGAEVVIQTGAGDRLVSLLERHGPRVVCRTAMGQVTGLHEELLQVAGQSVRCVVMDMGNPQCVVPGDDASLTEERLHTVGAALATHPRFAQGTNVELAAVVAPGHVRILIWERGVGPTMASGTGACAAAVAAVRFAGAVSPVVVEAPGGSQRVEVEADGVWLTGWAEVIGRFEWWGRP